MIYLIASIILSSYLTLAFKMLQRLNINVFQTIVFNYIACVITGSIVNGAFPINNENIHTPWFKWAVIMGFMFISIFNVVGLTTQKLGVAVASVANKLSLVIPFIFSLYLYNESATISKYLGIAVAIAAVVLTCYPSGKSSNQAHNKKLLFLLPIVLFISSGLLDTLIVYVQNHFFIEAGSNFNNFLISAFSVAGTVGICILLYQYFIKKQPFNIKPVIAGICIGIPNYFSIMFMGKMIAAYQGKSSTIIPVNNMGIVLFSAIVAWLLFKEKLTAINWAGIILSIAAIALIAFG